MLAINASTLTKPDSRQKRSTPFSPRATSPTGSSPAAAPPGKRFKTCRSPAAPTKNGCGPTSACSGSISFSLPIASSAGVTAQCELPAAPADRTASSLAGQHRRRSTVSRVDCSRASNPKWAKQGVLFGSLDELVRTHGDLIRPHLFRAVNPHADKFAALHAACWSGGTLLYVPQGVVIDEPLHMLSALSPGDSRFRPHAGHARRRRRSHAAGRNRRRRDGRRRRSGLHCGAIELIVGPGAKLRYVNLQNWGTGVWHFAHQKALVEARRPTAMDHRRPGQPAGQGQSARRPGRPRSRRAGQRRDVHRRQAAPLLSHAAAPSGAALQERPALQRRPARSIAHRLARHDQSRSAAPKRPTATSATTT